jgi:probable F420-dependent oxidoreductase
MKFGVSIPTCREGLVYRAPFATSRDIVRISEVAEDLGFDAVWGNDHITTQNYIKDKASRSNFYEPITTLSYIAGKTRSVKLATGVLALPLRDIVILAKQVSTLDVLSEGRLILGVGLGAYREEAESLGIRSKDRRDMLDEGIIAMRELFTHSPASHHGKHFKFTQIDLQPKPVQRPFPIYPGGNSTSSIRRAAELGQGWIPAALTPNEILEGYKMLEYFSKKAGRDPRSIEIVPEISTTIDLSQGRAIERYRRSPWADHWKSLRKTTMKSQTSAISHEERGFHGTPREIAKRIERYAHTPVRGFMLTFTAENVDELLDSLRIFSMQVMPSFK